MRWEAGEFPRGVSAGSDDGRHLDLEATLRLASRGISRVTHDVDRRSLVLRGHGHQLPVAP